MPTPTAPDLIRGAADGYRTLLALAGHPLVPEGKFDNRPTWDNPTPQFDNRPTWDNWNKK